MGATTGTVLRRTRRLKRDQERSRRPVRRNARYFVATLVGVLMIGIFSWFRGKDLAKDEV